MTAPFRSLALSRRSFLRGSGACLALPWLDAMTPALRPAPPPTARAMFVFAPNGKKMDDWKPRGEGRGARFPYLLEPLVPLRDRLTVVSGLAIDAGDAHGDGVGDHARSAATFLTCAHPRKTGGADIQVGVSVDQALAGALGGATSLPSLELGLEPGAAAGVCDSGYACAYSNNISWRTSNTPAAKETEPRAVFTRLFGDPDEPASVAERSDRRRRTRSILDLALADAKDLQRKLGPADQRKLEEYLGSIRDVERRIEHLEAEEAEAGRAAVGSAFLDENARDGLPGRLRTMYELCALAIQTDVTRIVSLMLGNAGSDRSYRFLGVPGGHHSLSHHGGAPDKLAAIRKINRFHVEEFARFITRLRDTADGEHDLLHNTIVVYGSGIGDGNRHNHNDLPVVVAGNAGGAMRMVGHLETRSDTPMANLYLTIMQSLGVKADSFADSDGTITDLA